MAIRRPLHVPRATERGALVGFNIGDRVRVQIADKTIYAQGAADALNGMEGTIERFKADGEALVNFDKSAPTWWSNQSPPTAHWFPLCDLVRL